MTDVLQLLREAPKPPEEGEPAGATEADLERLRDGLGYEIPAQLREWLSVCNGSHAGPGGIYGIGTGSGNLDIIWNLDLFPGRWREKRWIPVAGDGSGNRYVIDAGRAHLESEATYFVDAVEDPGSLAYVVSSDFSTFLRFLFENELGATGWPFNEEYVLARDPQLAQIKDTSLLPWRA